MPIEVGRAQTINRIAMDQGVCKPGIQTENPNQMKGTEKALVLPPKKTTRKKICVMGSKHLAVRLWERTLSFCFKTVSCVAQAGLKLTTQPRMTLVLEDRYIVPRPALWLPTH